METVSEKYQRLRPLISDGCIGLMSKNAIISRMIRNNDPNPDGSPATFSHCFLIFEKCGRKFVVDANENGVHPELLSVRLSQADNFTIIKPLANIDIINIALEKAFIRAEKSISYDFTNVIKAFINNKFGTKLQYKTRDEHDYCSDYCKDPAITMEIVNSLFSNLGIISPQDYLRYRNESNTTILEYFL